MVAPEVRISLLADRGFGDHKLYAYLQFLGWDFTIRFRGCIQVEDAAGVRKTAAEWLPPSGRATMLRNVKVTQKHAELPAVVVVHSKGMKEPWCLATTKADCRHRCREALRKSSPAKRPSATRKNLRFGWAFGDAPATRRRDRALLRDR